MSRNINRQEAMRIAAEKMRQKKEKEEREEKEFYERITSGNPWLIFKIVVVFCTLLSILATFDHFVDGPSKKLTEEEWEINREWEWPWHKVLDVEGCMFTPLLNDWSDHVENTIEITYTPIFRTGKKLSYDMPVGESGVRRHEEIRQRSVFTWFPTFQLFLLIPLFTFLFKRQSPWFNFARIVSLVFILPGSLIVIFFAMM